MLKFQRIQVNETGLRVIFASFSLFSLFCFFLHDYGIMKVTVDLQINNAVQKLFRPRNEQSSTLIHLASLSSLADQMPIFSQEVFVFY